MIRHPSHPHRTAELLFAACDVTGLALDIHFKTAIPRKGWLVTPPPPPRIRPCGEPSECCHSESYRHFHDWDTWKSHFLSFCGRTLDMQRVAYALTAIWRFFRKTGLTTAHSVTIPCQMFSRAPGAIDPSYTVHVTWSNIMRPSTIYWLNARAPTCADLNTVSCSGYRFFSFYRVK